MTLGAALLIGILLACLLAWCWQRRYRNGGYADVLWSAGVGVLGLIWLVTGEGALAPRLAAAVLLLFWSLRLSWHIWRRVHGHQEEGRYQAMRHRAERHIEVLLLAFFLAQGLLAWLFALPHSLIASHPGGNLYWLAGLLLGIVAISAEALADAQLAAFRADPANRGYTCRQGLWRYSRHPNYFFEWLHWFAYPLIALGADGAGWLWLAPLCMLLFLWFVTGIPFTEQQALRSRGEDYRRYQRTTSMFFPWRPGT